MRVPAKVNLSLAVGARQDDGYHDLLTVFMALSLFDEVTATSAEQGLIDLVMSGPGTRSVPRDDRNLAVRAARLLRTRYGHPELGASLELKKAIPVAGGMAGGSADAAGALLACSVLWDLDTTPDDLQVLGAALGADVPFGLVGNCAIGSGRGDKLVPVLCRGTYHWVLALAPRGLSTPAVFHRFDELADPQASTDLELPTAAINALTSGDVRALAANLRNDLQDAALDLYPQLADTLAAGRRAGALAGIVSGSGPTCAFLCADESASLEVAAALIGTPGVRAVKRAHGPVPGAQLLV